MALEVVQGDDDIRVHHGAADLGLLDILAALHGEMCIRDSYMDNPEETAQTLQVHPDGLTWVHTGDLGSMDDDGFIYFKQRIKRMIVTSGYNVYPSQLENVFDAHELVQMSCVIGVPDPLKMQKVKAFITVSYTHLDVYKRQAIYRPSS